MYRCLELAEKGLRNAMPNPSVGAVIVHNNKIIGEGFTSKYGGNHAEVNAINAVKNKELLSESTIYVSLEPCSHFGNTPPCANLLAKHQFKHVIIGCADSNPLVDGKGIKKIKNVGCKVKIGILESECRESNKRFFTFQEKKRPYIILKWAQSADGFIDKTRLNTTQKPAKITAQPANILVHKWRSEETAIMIGTNTAILDNPSLTVRYMDGINPIRIVIDRENKLPKSLSIFDNSAHTICYTENYSYQEKNNKWVIINFENTLDTILQDLYQRNILSVFVEGGQKLHQSFIDNNLWDEARVFIGSKNITNGIKSPKLIQLPHRTKWIGVNQLLTFQND